MRRHTRDSLHARLARLEDRPGPLRFRYRTIDGSLVDVPIDVALAVICGREVGEQWELVVARIVAPAEERCGLLVGLVATAGRGDEPS